KRTTVELVEQRNRVALEPRRELGVGYLGPVGFRRRWRRVGRRPVNVSHCGEHRPFRCSATKQARYVHRTFEANGRHQRPLPSILEAATDMTRSAGRTALNNSTDGLCCSRTTLSRWHVQLPRRSRPCLRRRSPTRCCSITTTRATSHMARRPSRNL